QEIFEIIHCNNKNTLESINVLGKPTQTTVTSASNTEIQSAKTLNSVLSLQAKFNPTIVHLRILRETKEVECLTFGELYIEASKFAAGLIANNLLPGDRVILMLPTGKDYFISFFGILLATGVPVPVYPPARAGQIAEHLSRHASIAANSGAVMMIADETILPFAQNIRSRSITLRLVDSPDKIKSKSALSQIPQPKPEDVALIQYTSGSTGDPKGVVLSHSNLLANIRAMGNRLEVDSSDVFVSWLPLYHDMGLIGAWLGSLTFGSQLIIMSPLNFIARPSRWLWAIHKYKGTISGGPNFGYDACISRFQRESFNDLDLSSWRVAFNGAETVQSTTLLKFEEAFKNNGFRSKALMPVYGLAENSVGLAFPPLNQGPKIDQIDRLQLNK
ncbi:MAG: AMP-binding protein, partial [Pseudomonadota bacterium]|nr:AMP-binding protein [Pseudomonadota bacterium]